MHFAQQAEARNAQARRQILLGDEGSGVGVPDPAFERSGGLARAAWQQRQENKEEAQGYAEIGVLTGLPEKCR